MQDVGRDLLQLEKQGKVEGFFNNAENSAKLSGFVEEIRDAMLEYQVCGSAAYFCNIQHLWQTSLQQDIYDKQQDISDKQRDIYDKQLDISDKSRSLVVTYPPLASQSHGITNV